MKRSLTLLAVLTLLIAPDANAQGDPNYTLTIGSDNGSVGSTVEIAALLNFANGVSLSGVSYGVCHDASIVGINCTGGIPNDCVDNDIIRQGAALQATNNGTGAGFFAPAVVSSPADGYTVGVVINLLGGDVLQPAPDAEIAVATYECLSPGSTDLTVCETGRPIVQLSIGFSTGGGTDPVTVAGQIQVTMGDPLGYRFGLGFPNGGIRYSIEDGVGTGEVEILISEDPGSPGFPNQTQGFSYGLRHSGSIFIEDSGTPPALDRGIRPSPILQALNGGTGPEFFGPNSSPENGPGHTLGVVYALLGGSFLTFESPTPVVVVIYHTEPNDFIGNETGASMELRWANDLGNPVVVPGVAVADLPPDAPNALIEYEPPLGTSTMVMIEPINDEFLRGDCNDDGEVDIADGIFLLNNLFQGGASSPCQEACDANGDGLSDSSDAVYIVNYRFIEGPEPPAPFPACGVAPGQEEVDCEAGSCL